MFLLSDHYIQPVNLRQRCFICNREDTLLFHILYHREEQCRKCQGTQNSNQQNFSGIFASYLYWFFFLDCDEIFYDVVWQSQHPESYLSGGCDNTDFHFLPNWWLNPGSEWPKLDNVTLEIILIYSLSSFLIMVNSWLHPLHWAKRRGDVKGMTAAGPRMRKHQHPVRVSEGKCELQAVKQKANQIRSSNRQSWDLKTH